MSWHINTYDKKIPCRASECDITIPSDVDISKLRKKDFKFLTKFPPLEITDIVNSAKKVEIAATGLDYEVTITMKAEKRSIQAHIEWNGPRAERITYLGDRIYHQYVRAQEARENKYGN